MLDQDLLAFAGQQIAILESVYRTTGLFTLLIIPWIIKIWYGH